MMKKLGKHSYKSYLEAVFALTQAKDAVSLDDVAEYLDEPGKHVKFAAGLMKKAADAKIDKNGCIRLTEAGKKKAAQVYDRRNYFQKLLMKAGVNKRTAKEEAQKLGDTISQETFEQLRLYTLLLHVNAT